jgi:hypothetical protein
MAKQSGAAPTNERIIDLLEEIKARLAETERRNEQLARDVRRLLDR